MMMFIMMFIGAIACIMATSVLMGGFVHTLKTDHDNRNAVSFGAGSAWLTASLAIALIFGNNITVLPFLGYFFLILWSVLFLQMRTDHLTRELFLFSICIAATFVIPMDKPLLPGIWGVYTYLILGTGLYLMTRLFAVLDRVPLFSLIMLMTQGMLVILMGDRLGLTPAIIRIMFYFFVITMAIAQTTKVFTGKTVLGPFAATLVGLSVGGFWTYQATRGLPAVPVILFGYNLVEVLIAFLTGLLSTGTFTSRPFLIERALNSGIAPNKLYRFVFLMFLPLSLLALLAAQEGLSQTVVIFGIILLIAYVFRLEHWGQVQPSFGQLAKDVGQGLKELKTELTHIPLKADKVHKSTKGNRVQKTPKRKKK